MKCGSIVRRRRKAQPVVAVIQSPASCLLFLAVFPARNPKGKVPGPASIVKVEAAGDGGTTLTSADGPYNDGAFRAKISPSITNSVEIWRVRAHAVVGLPLYWAILRFPVKGIGWRDCAACSSAGLFTIRNGARGHTGRARGELKTVRLEGPRHENAF